MSNPSFVQEQDKKQQQEKRRGCVHTEICMFQVFIAVFQPINQRTDEDLAGYNVINKYLGACKFQCVNSLSFSFVAAFFVLTIHLFFPHSCTL